MRLFLLLVTLIQPFFLNAGPGLIFKVEGIVSFPSLRKFAYLYILPAGKKAPVLLATELDKGQFLFTGEIDQAKGRYSVARLFLYEYNGLSKNDCNVLLQSGKLKYRTLILEELVHVKIDSLVEHSSVTGSDRNKDFDQLMEVKETNSIRVKNLKEAYQKSVNDIHVKASEKKRIRSLYLWSLSELSLQRTSDMLQYIGKNPASPLALEQLNLIASMDLASIRKFQKDIAEVLPVIPAQWFETVKGRSLVDALKRNSRGLKLVTGKKMPGYTFSDDKDSVSLADFKGKYFLLYFWASWSANCQKEQISLKAAFDKFSSRGFTILQVSLDVGMKNWRRVLEKDGINWKHARCKKGWDLQVEKAFEIYGVPTSYLVDPMGKIIARDLTGKQLENKLLEVFP